MQDTPDDTGTEQSEPPLEITSEELEPDSEAAPPEVAPEPAAAGEEVPPVSPPTVEPPAAEQPPSPESPAPEADQWYLSAEGKVYGPYSAPQVRAWLTGGQVVATMLASRGAHEAWRPLTAVPEFAAATATAAPTAAPLAYSAAYPVRKRKERVVAGILGILLGWVGGHHWYLENWLLAVLYLLLGWTGLPGLLGMIEGILYLVADEERFQRNYSNWFMSGP